MIIQPFTHTWRCWKVICQVGNDLKPWNLHYTSHIHYQVQHKLHIISQINPSKKKKKQTNWYLVNEILLCWCYQLQITGKFLPFQTLFKIRKQEIVKWSKIWWAEWMIFALKSQIILQNIQHLVNKFIVLQIKYTFLQLPSPFFLQFVL